MSRDFLNKMHEALEESDYDYAEALDILIWDEIEAKDYYDSIADRIICKYCDEDCFDKYTLKDHEEECEYNPESNNYKGEEDVFIENHAFGGNHLVGMFTAFIVSVAYYHFTGHNTNDIIPFLIIAMFCASMEFYIRHRRERDKDLCEGED